MMYRPGEKLIPAKEQRSYRFLSDYLFQLSWNDPEIIPKWRGEFDKGYDVGKENFQISFNEIQPSGFEYLLQWLADTKKEAEEADGYLCTQFKATLGGKMDFYKSGYFQAYYDEAERILNIYKKTATNREAKKIKQFVAQNSEYTQAYPTAFEDTLSEKWIRNQKFNSLVEQIKIIKNNGELSFNEIQAQLTGYRSEFQQETLNNLLNMHSQDVKARYVVSLIEGFKKIRFPLRNSNSIPSVDFYVSMELDAIITTLSIWLRDKVGLEINPATYSIAPSVPLTTTETQPQLEASLKNYEATVTKLSEKDARGSKVYDKPEESGQIDSSNSNENKGPTFESLFTDLANAQKVLEAIKEHLADNGNWNGGSPSINLPALCNVLIRQGYINGNLFSAPKLTHAFNIQFGTTLSDTNFKPGQRQRHQVLDAESQFRLIPKANK